ncbi:hypothetical protein Ddc_15912 [Ditylenchus destructor]|nr:hypothetical protein Ddc_15912 [Ditylenchus destructor]
MAISCQIISASPVLNSDKDAEIITATEGANFCSEYPRLSLCQLRSVLDNAILEIDFLVNGMGAGLANNEYTTAFVGSNSEGDPWVPAQRKQKRQVLHPSNRLRLFNRALLDRTQYKRNSQENDSTPKRSNSENSAGKE